MKHTMKSTALPGYAYFYRGFSIAPIYGGSMWNQKAVAWYADGLRGEKFKAKTLQLLRREIDQALA